MDAEGCIPFDITKDINGNELPFPIRIQVYLKQAPMSTVCRYCHVGPYVVAQESMPLELLNTLEPFESLLICTCAGHFVEN